MIRVQAQNDAEDDRVIIERRPTRSPELKKTYCVLPDGVVLMSREEAYSRNNPERVETGGD